VGPITLQGCAGLEIIGYSQSAGGGVPGTELFYVGIRNNGNVERIVDVEVIRPPTLRPKGNT
jgi:hypothetical protein